MGTEPCLLDDYVTIAVYARASGYSENAIRLKIRDGVWLQDREYVRSQDGHVMIYRPGVHQWHRRGKR